MIEVCRGGDEGTEFSFSFAAHVLRVTHASCDTGSRKSVCAVPILTQENIQKCDSTFQVDPNAPAQGTAQVVLAPVKEEGGGNVAAQQQQPASLAGGVVLQPAAQGGAPAGLQQLPAGDQAEKDNQKQGVFTTMLSRCVLAVSVVQDDYEEGCLMLRMTRAVTSKQCILYLLHRRQTSQGRDVNHLKLTYRDAVFSVDAGGADAGVARRSAGRRRGRR